MFTLDESKIGRVSHQLSFGKTLEIYRNVVCYNIPDLPQIEKSHRFYYDGVIGEKVSDMVKVGELSVRSAYALAKKKKSNLILSGRDGWLYFMVSAYYGIPSIWFPFWSRKNAWTDSVNYFIRENSGEDPVFLDTGFSGSIFRSYQRFWQHTTNENLFVTFLLSSHDDFCESFADNQKTKEMNIQTHRIKGVREIVLNIEHDFNHPVVSGNEIGEFIPVKEDNWMIFNSGYKTTAAYLGSEMLKLSARVWECLLQKGRSTSNRR